MVRMIERVERTHRLAANFLHTPCLLGKCSCRRSNDPGALTASISGTPSKGRIYVLHGVTDNAASLSDISARWSSDYEVVLVDALGHGCSPHFTPTQLEDPFEALVSSAATAVCRHHPSPTPGGDRSTARRSGARDPSGRAHVNMIRYTVLTVGLQSSTTLRK